MSKKTSRENFDEYAKRSGGFGFHKFDNVSVNMKDLIAGIGCCVSLNKNCHVFIMSTDSEKLQEALDELGVKKEERSAKDVSLVAMYPASIIEEVIENEEGNRNKIFWVIDQNGDGYNAEMQYSFSLKYRPDLKIIGEATRFNKTECKLLLRNKGWKRDDIEELIIDEDHPDDKIPF